MFKIVLWDNDGVLVDTERLYFQATRETLAPEGIALTEDLFRTHFLVNASGIRAVLHDRSDEEVGRIRSIRDARYNELLTRGDYLLPDVEPVLASLAGSMRMAVVTSSLRTHFERIHSRTGLLRYFEFVLASGDYPETKPHPAPYLTAVARFSAAPEECLVIEDSERGLRAAKAAGLTCWVLPSPLTRASDLSAADAVLEHISEIPGKLRALGCLA